MTDAASGYYQVVISAEQTVQANRILDALLAARLVLGGPIVGGPAKFLWNFATTNADVSAQTAALGVVAVEQDYRLILTYTRAELKERVIAAAEAASLEKICMISFLPMEPNRALAELIDDCVRRDDDAAASAPGTVDAVAAVTYVPVSAIPERTISS